MHSTHYNRVGIWRTGVDGMCHAFSVIATGSWDCVWYNDGSAKPPLRFWRRCRGGCVPPLIAPVPSVCVCLYVRSRPDKPVHNPNQVDMVPTTTDTVLFVEPHRITLPYRWYNVLPYGMYFHRKDNWASVLCTLYYGQPLKHEKLYSSTSITLTIFDQ